MNYIKLKVVKFACSYGVLTWYDRDMLYFVLFFIIVIHFPIKLLLLSIDWICCVFLLFLDFLFVFRTGSMSSPLANKPLTAVINQLIIWDAEQVWR